MAGYVPEETTYRLVFEGKRAGLVAVCGEGTVNDYMAISALASEPFSQPPTRDDLDRMRSLFVALGSVLRSWNVERPAGVPMPATVESVGLLGMSLALDIANAWMEAVAGVPDPLSVPSQDGGSTGNAELESTMSMATLPTSAYPSR